MRRPAGVNLTVMPRSGRPPPSLLTAPSAPSAAPVPQAPGAPTRGTRRLLWIALRIAVFASLVYLGFLVVSSNSAELSGATSYLGRAQWDWILAAIAAEVLSYLAFTQLQRR